MTTNLTGSPCGTPACEIVCRPALAGVEGLRCAGKWLVQDWGGSEIESPMDVLAGPPEELRPFAPNAATLVVPSLARAECRRWTSQEA